MWQDLLIGFCLFLVIEGVMPFLNPKAFRETMLKAVQMDDSTLRFVGLTCMLIGVGLLYWIR
ncbi:MAG: DUF2065 domain-containing protein [Gammaproteobacteria bacterium]